MPDGKSVSTGKVVRLLHVTPMAGFRWICAGKLKRRDPDASVVLITGYPHYDETLAALE